MHWATIKTWGFICLIWNKWVVKPMFWRMWQLCHGVSKNDWFMPCLDIFLSTCLWEKLNRLNLMQCVRIDCENGPTSTERLSTSLNKNVTNPGIWSASSMWGLSRPLGFWLFFFIVWTLLNSIEPMFCLGFPHPNCSCLVGWMNWFSQYVYQPTKIPKYFSSSTDGHQSLRKSWAASHAHTALALSSEGV